MDVCTSQTQTAASFYTCTLGHLLWDIELFCGLEKGKANRRLETLLLVLLTESWNGDECAESLSFFGKVEVIRL